MIDIDCAVPITLLYRGDIYDTAVLCGLVQIQKSIGVIAYTGPLDKKSMNYVNQVNAWLELKNQPRIQIHPHLSMQQLEQILSCPLDRWSWKDQECRAAVLLAGLPLPG